MKNLNKIKLVLLSTVLFYSTLVFAVESYYDQRPSIHKTAAKNNPGVREWKEASRGHFLFLAQMLTFFPNSDYYFLARDIEYLYDMTELLVKDNPKLKERIHLVPISTSLSHESQNLERYLEQEGVTKKRLGDRSALFIDSCCAGSVPDRIQATMKKKGIQVQGFLIQTDNYPKSQLAEISGADGLAIEDLPHFNDSATEYVDKNGKLRIVARLASKSEQTKSVQIMQQIRYEYDNAKSRSELRELVGYMRTVYSYFVTKSPYPKATREQAIAAMKMMITKFDIPVTTFLQDIKSMRKKGYAVVPDSHLAEFLSPKSTLVTFDNENLARKLVTNPSKLEELIDKNHSGVDYQKIVQHAVKLLVASDAKELGITETQYKNLVHKWVDHYNNYIDMPNTIDQVRAMLELYLKVQTPKRAVQEMLDKMSYSVMKDNAKAMSEILISAIEKDGYKYSKDSVIQHLINGYEDWTKNPKVFSTVMTNVIENSTETELSKIVIDLFKMAPDHYFYNDGQTANFVTEFTKIIKLAINSLPTISKPMVAAYLQSEMGVRPQDFKPFSEFSKWLFSQREYFEKAALDLKVDYYQAALLSHKKAPNEYSSVQVRDIVDHFDPSGAPKQSVPSLNGLRGKVCSQIFRTK